MLRVSEIFNRFKKETIQGWKGYKDFIKIYFIVKCNKFRLFLFKNLEITNKNLVIINLTRQNLIQLFYRTIKSVHQVYIDLFICDSI